MAKIEAAIKESIARGARREVRRVAKPLKREVWRLRRVLAAVREEVAALRGAAVQWERATDGTPWRPQVSEEETKAARLSPRLVRKLRERLGLSQSALARLVGVSAAAVVQWERGRSSPSGQNRSALVSLRRLGRRAVKRLLAARPKPTAARKASARRVGGQKRRPRARRRTRRARR